MVHRFHVFTLSALVVVAAAGGAMVSAQGPGPGGPRGGGPGIGRGGQGGGLPLRELELTDAQRGQVQQITQQHRDREQTRELFERARAAREGQRLAMDAMPFNEQQIRAAMQAVAEAETEVAVQQARLQSDIYALLTPVQQQQVQKMRADREAGMKERQQRRQRGPGQPRPQA